jgi:crotonobetainyl-CoA:carnitine CoA-transferase CaiB-like acyl-CoA transferase
MGIRIGNTETTYCNSVNCNKRSITLTCRPRRVRSSTTCCRSSTWSSQLPPAAEKLSLGYDQLKAVRPDLIYCAVTGYDSSGPEASRPGDDLVIQGEAGLMALNGEANTPPLKFGVAVVDLMTGMGAAQAVLAALFRRERTGKGRLIEMALYDSGLMVTGCYGLMR